MDFNEKLQSLRKARQLTQEELAEAIFVSRTAVSKWESGRGYPSIDSLKELSRFFRVSIDELIGPDEIVAAAEDDRSSFAKKSAVLFCGLLDALTSLLLFMPVFGDSANSHSIATALSLTGVAPWTKAAFIIVIAVTVVAGICETVASHTEWPHLSRISLLAGLAASSIGVIVFIASRQPYAGIVFFAFLLIKGLLLARAFTS